MGIGGSILLIVVGAILTFGLDDTDLGPFNLDTIGWIFQIAGLFGLVLTLYFWNTRRRTVVRQVPRRRRRWHDDPAVGGRGHRASPHLLSRT
ncbi:DUF6458 family protein [Dactylosporangium cerinum]